MMQGFAFKAGQRFFHAFNNTPMGYSLPGAIGGAFARPGQRMICITGDGSIQMNIQELATVIRHRLPLKVFLHSTITAIAWCSRLRRCGLVEPTTRHVHKAGRAGRARILWPSRWAYGFPADSVELNADIPSKLAEALETDGPYFLNIEIDPKHRVIPQVKFGRPNEDADPLLPREEFLANMLIEPLPVSLQK